MLTPRLQNTNITQLWYWTIYCKVKQNENKTINYTNFNLLTTLISIAVITACLENAEANNHKDEIESMKKQIEFLMGEVERLKKTTKNNSSLSNKLKDMQVKQEAESDTLQKEVNTLMSKKTFVDSDTGIEITLDPTPKVSYGDVSWQPFGILHIDSAYFNDDNFDHPDGTEMRRARLGMKGTISKDFAYIMEADFGNSNTALINAFISYTGFENGEIRFGNNRSPYSLEASTSTDHTTFIEFSAPTAAFDVGEIVGVGGFFHDKHWSLGAGVYNQNTALQDTDDEGWRTAARATLAPINDDKKLLHVGVSGAYVASRSQTNSFTFGATAENAIQTTNSVQATIASADSHSILGMEAAALYGPFSIQGEYFITDVDTNTGGTDATFNGGYAQISYFLTGERRPYEQGNGTFGRIVPNNDFTSKGGMGAWEIAARYSMLDLNDGTVTGGKMDSYTIGVNWYLNKNTRLMLNYIDTDTDANAFSAADDSPSLMLLRGQIIF